MSPQRLCVLLALATHIHGLIVIHTNRNLHLHTDGTAYYSIAISSPSEKVRDMLHLCTSPTSCPQRLLVGSCSDLAWPHGPLRCLFHTRLGTKENWCKLIVTSWPRGHGPTCTLTMRNRTLIGHSGSKVAKTSNIKVFFSKYLCLASSTLLWIKQKVWSTKIRRIGNSPSQKSNKNP